MSQRLFLGLELPDSLRRTLALLEPECRSVRGLRWQPPENLHLTLSFLGDVENVRAERLRETLPGVRVPPFFLPVQGLGTFGGARPTVLWAGVGKGHPHLFALHQHLQDAVLQAGIEADLRPFHPHITLARMKAVAATALRPLLRAHESAEFGLWKVERFTLFSSHTGAEGTHYVAEFTQPLE